MRRFAVIWAAILILTVVVAITAHTAFTSQAHQNNTVREGWCYFERAVLSSPLRSQKQKLQAIHFFNGLTHDLGVAPCPIPTPKGGTNA